MTNMKKETGAQTRQQSVRACLPTRWAVTLLPHMLTPPTHPHTCTPPQRAGDDPANMIGFAQLTVGGSLGWG